MNLPDCLKSMCQTTSNSRLAEGNQIGTQHYLMIILLIWPLFREVVMLKSLWDMIALVKSSFADWNSTLWCDINVEQIEMDCKKFVKV